VPPEGVLGERDIRLQNDAAPVVKCGRRSGRRETSQVVEAAALLP